MTAARNASNIIFITGTDTGVGKTVLTGLLLAHLRRRGVQAHAIKPFISGAWDDARLLAELQDNELTLDEISPFFFPEPVAPLVSARKHRKNVPLKAVLEVIAVQKQKCEILLVEGVGGLRVPLGKGYSVADVIAAVRPMVIVTAANRLGVLNHAILTGRDLDNIGIKRYVTVLMGQKPPPAMVNANIRVLRESFSPNEVFELPNLGKNASNCRVLRTCEKKFHKTVAHIVGSCRVIPVATLKALRQSSKTKLK